MSWRVNVTVKFEKAIHQNAAQVGVCLSSESKKEKVCAPHASQGGPHGLVPYRMSQPIWDSFVTTNSSIQFIRQLQHIQAANHVDIRGKKEILSSHGVNRHHFSFGIVMAVKHEALNM